MIKEVICVSEGPYRNMSYEDAANAMSRIYKLLYPRKFHSYNPSLDLELINNDASVMI